MTEVIMPPVLSARVDERASTNIEDREREREREREGTLDNATTHCRLHSAGSAARAGGQTGQRANNIKFGLYFIASARFRSDRFLDCDERLI
ncbi:hypothetical protein VTN49DRAFT_630 [Thermomyces lanuginosus]|uniref:uncharacterized protein n=1 Tax=Thermomyces lanuginosus TaxID=5541 RepID=UPI0037420AC1